MVILKTSKIYIRTLRSKTTTIHNISKMSQYMPFWVQKRKKPLLRAFGKSAIQGPRFVKIINSKYLLFLMENNRGYAHYCLTFLFCFSVFWKFYYLFKQLWFSVKGKYITFLFRLKYGKIWSTTLETFFFRLHLTTI